MLFFFPVVYMSFTRTLLTFIFSIILFLLHVYEWNKWMITTVCFLFKILVVKLTMRNSCCRILSVHFMYYDFTPYNQAVLCICSPVFVTLHFIFLADDTFKIMFSKKYTSIKVCTPLLESLICGMIIGMIIISTIK